MGLKNNRIYILCLGAFRNKEERQLVISLSKSYKGKNRVEILAPSFYTVPYRNNPIRFCLMYAKYIMYKLRYRNIHTERLNVNNERLPYFFGASDISFIHRLHILNSGNVPLALYMGNIIIGPQSGNVGEILKRTGNILFNPQDLSTLSAAINKGINLINKQKGLENHNYAIKHLNTRNISKELYITFQKLLNFTHHEQ